MTLPRFGEYLIASVAPIDAMSSIETKNTWPTISCGREPLRDTSAAAPDRIPTRPIEMWIPRRTMCVSVIVSTTATSSGRAHRDRRIDPRRTQCRNPARDRSDRSHHHRHADERRRIVRLYAEQQSSDEPRGEERAHHAHPEAKDQQHATLAEDHPLHARAIGAEAHANADLVRARTHRECQHT